LVAATVAKHLKIAISPGLAKETVLVEEGEEAGEQMAVAKGMERGVGKRKEVVERTTVELVVAVVAKHLQIAISPGLTKETVLVEEGAGAGKEGARTTLALAGAVAAKNRLVAGDLLS
jgi:hypothetical protein